MSRRDSSPYLNQCPTSNVLVAFIAMLGLLSGCWHPRSGADPFDLRGAGLPHQQGGKQYEYALPAQPTTTVAATLPATLAVARIQQSGRHYISEARTRYDDGDFLSLTQTLTTDHREELGSLYGISDVIVLAPPPTRPERGQRGHVLNAVRQEAHRVGAELLLLLTFASDSETHSILPPLSVLTLGMLPQDFAEAEAAGHAVLMDVRTGHVFAYGTVTRDTWQLANSWTVNKAQRDAVKRAEQRVLTRLLETLGPRWPAVTHAMR